jgi:hypothetical protein
MGGRTGFRLSETCKMYLGEIEEIEVYDRWLEETRAKVNEPLKEFLCLEVTKHCKDDPFNDFGNKPEKDDGFEKYVKKEL